MASVFFNTTLAATLARVLADIQQILQNSNPFLRNSFLRAMGTALAGRVNDFYLQGQQLEIQLFPDTATGNYAIRWGSLKGITPDVAQPAGGVDALGNQLGLIDIFGTVGTVIPAGTGVQSLAGVQYTTQGINTIGVQSINIAAISSVGTTAFVTTVSDHHFSNNPTMPTVTIAGVNSTYNGTWEISVTSPTTFNYTIPSSSGSYTNTGTASSTFASVNVLAATTGSNGNLTSGSQLNITTTIPGAQIQAFVQSYGVSGGQDPENSFAYRQRYLYSYANPFALFNTSHIIATCKTVQNVTRVWVDPATPIAGMVTVWFVNDNQLDTVLPTADQVALVTQALSLILPDNMLIEDVFINKDSNTNPLTDLPVQFTFTDLVPNTATMQASIEQNLQQYFLTQTEPGVSITQDTYRSIIQNSFDEGTGQPLESFVISTSGTIVVSDYQIPVYVPPIWDIS